MAFAAANSPRYQAMIASRANVSGSCICWEEAAGGSGTAIEAGGDVGPSAEVIFVEERKAVSAAGGGSWDISATVVSVADTKCVPLRNGLLQWRKRTRREMGRGSSYIYIYINGKMDAWNELT